MSVNRTSLGKRISFYRSKSNLTQEVLAAKVNCSREYIVQIENIEDIILHRFLCDGMNGLLCIPQKPKEASALCGVEVE